jgi:hypothetical protein
LVDPAKDLCVVLNKAIIGVGDSVGRVTVNHVALTGTPHCNREVLDLDRRAVQRLASGVQLLGIANNEGLRMSTERNVEFAFEIDAVEAVEAGLVEINEPCRLGGW